MSIAVCRAMARNLDLPRDAAERIHRSYSWCPTWSLSTVTALCYRQGKAGGERRLHGARSLGIGGHINALTDRPANPRIAAVAREVGRGNRIDSPFRLRVVSLVLILQRPLARSILAFVQCAGWSHRDGAGRSFSCRRRLLVDSRRTESEFELVRIRSRALL